MPLRTAAQSGLSSCILTDYAGPQCSCTDVVERQAHWDDNLAGEKGRKTTRDTFAQQELHTYTDLLLLRQSPNLSLSENETLDLTKY